MARSKAVNGIGGNGNGMNGPAQVIALTKKRFRRGTVDDFAEDFCKVCEVAADDVVNLRLSPAVHNSMRGAYSNMLHMIDIQMRARTMGLVGSKRKLLSK